MGKYVATVGNRQCQANVLFHHEYAYACVVGNATNNGQHALNDDGSKTKAHFVDQKHLWF